MSKILARSFQVLAGNANTHKNCLRKRKFQKSSTMNVLDSEMGPWGTNMTGTHSNKFNWPEIENSLWKSHILSIFCFMKKNSDLIIFRTFISKNCLFFGIFDQKCFLPNHYEFKTKVVLNFIWNWFWTTFVATCSDYH